MSIKKNESFEYAYQSLNEEQLLKPEKCSNCGCVLEVENKNFVQDCIKFGVYNHAQRIYFVGGYGAFYDVIPNEEPPNIIFCHDCMHELCDKYPIIGELLKDGHSH